MPGRRRRLARPLPQGLAHHLDLRRLRLGGRRGEAARTEREADRVGAGQRLDAVGGPVRMPGLAGQERQRRQCRAQRPVVGAAGGEGLRRTGRADRRRAGLSRRDGRAAELGGADRRPGRDLGGEQQFAQALSRGLRDPSPARLRARLAARSIPATPVERVAVRGNPAAAAAHRPARGRDRPRDRRSACSTPSPRRWCWARPGSISSPTPASTIPPSGRCAAGSRWRAIRRSRPSPSRWISGPRDGKKHSVSTQAARGSSANPLKDARDRARSSGRGEELAARPRHPAADRCGVGAGQERRCVEPGGDDGTALVVNADRVPQASLTRHLSAH